MHSIKINLQFSKALFIIYSVLFLGALFLLLDIYRKVHFSPVVYVILTVAIIINYLIALRNDIWHIGKNVTKNLIVMTNPPRCRFISSDGKVKEILLGQKNIITNLYLVLDFKEKVHFFSKKILIPRDSLTSGQYRQTRLLLQQMITEKPEQ